MFLNNNFQFLNTHTKRALKHWSFTKLSHKSEGPTAIGYWQEGTKLVALYCLNSTHSTFTKEKLNTWYIYYTIAILESAKRQLLLLNKWMKSKELKFEKIKKRKKKRAKSVQWQERTERRKRRRMQSPSPQRLNGDKESERERASHLCKSARKIFSVLQDCYNCVAMWERQNFRLFNFFTVYK